MEELSASAHKLMRTLTFDIARVTEAAAVAAAHHRGRGDEMKADVAAARAMRRELSDLPISGRIVIGEGEQDEVPVLYIGEELGRGGSEVDIAVDPLEGISLCAKSLPGALSVLAIAQRGGLLHAPDMYMEKIAIGPGYEAGVVSLDRTVAENLNRLAEAKCVPVREITACVLDRPRHAKLIEEIRAASAGIALIGDGDIAGVIHTCEPEETGIDIYLGTGGAPEGVLAAAALRCTGGRDPRQVERVERRARQTRRDPRDNRPGPHILNRGHGVRRYYLRRDRRDRRLALERGEIRRRAG